jgi:hypothetical protein
MEEAKAKLESIRIEDSGIVFMEKSRQESKKNLLSFISSRIRGVNSLYTYLIKFTLYAIIDQLESNSSSMLESDDSIGGLEDQISEQKIELPKEFSKLNRLVSMIDVLVQLEAEFRVPIVGIPTSSQISLLGTSLRQCITSVMEMYESFLRGIFPLLLAGEVDFSLDEIQEHWNTNTLLIAFDQLFNQVQGPFAEFSTIPDTDRIMYVEKLQCVKKILETVSESPRDITSQSNLHAQLRSILQSYIENIITKITMTTFAGLLRTWGIDRENRSVLEIAQVEVQWVDSTDFEMLNIVMTNYLTAQQVLDEEKLLNVNHLQDHELCKYISTSLQNELVKFMWGNLHRDQIVNDSSRFVQSWRNRLLASLSTKSASLKHLTETINVQCTQYRKIEPSITNQIRNSVSSQQYQVLLDNIRARDDNLTRISAHDLQFAQLCQSIVELENYRSKNEFNDKMRQELRPLIEKWATLNHDEHTVSRQKEAAAERLETITRDVESMSATLKTLTPYVKKNHSTIHGIEEKYLQMVNEIILEIKSVEEHFIKYLQVISEVENMVESIVRVTTGFKNWNATLKNFRTYLQSHDKFCRSVFTDLIKKRFDPIKDSIRDFNIKEMAIVDILEKITSANQYIVVQLETIRQQITKHSTTNAFDNEDDDINVDEDEEPQKEVGNSYAIGVLKRVQSRLECPENVSDQVANVILQSTSLDNLCSMYEGWSAWI